ncbi:hypothetical protein JHN53_11625 [Streptomyces sp. MBT58]|uniref:hypothetical protein n=1 Tax=Streptomyces sp. MBT58 TaxID=1488389 RepID=UPI001913118C|nr:hypothetical protein [Streptomyces sp. MBT58]MBK5992278.1 hypothetical protein [Streptomyces sp. MBT58]
MRSGQGGPSVVSRLKPLPVVQVSVLLSGPASAVARIRRSSDDRVANGSIAETS